ncbi:MAG: MarR family winged helix-turn-helix transcriptional regulator [Chloroflexota bacterium]
MHANQTRAQPHIDPTSQLYCLNANLRKASRMILSLYMDEMHDSGLKGTQFTLLSTVSGFGAVKVGDLAQFMGMDQTTVTRNVNVLKKDGYLQVVPGDDKRTRFIQLTEKGMTAVRETHPKWLEAQTKLWKELGDEKATQLLKLSQQIIDIAERRG